MNNTRSGLSIFNVIGPGLLFAGSAIGVSHLVQSTRAGAMYGLALLVFILLSLLAKYPAFYFAPRYAAATGRSLLSSYRRQGVFALGTFCISTILTMFIGTAANLLVTAGLAKAALGLQADIFHVAIILSVMGIALLILGHYRWLDRVIKVLVVVLTLATVAATLISLPLIDMSVSGSWFPAELNRTTILFIAALVGWMPAPLDVSIWQSQWAVAKMRDTGYVPTQKEARIDFNIGYLATLILALCFVVLGTAMMHGTGISFEENPTGFATQVINLYQEALGTWSTYIIGVAVLAVMFSTYLTILDGFPRALANLALLIKGKEEVADEDPVSNRQRRRYYWISLLAMVFGALALLSFFLGNLSLLIDFAATISFLAAPAFAYFNHRAMLGPEIPDEAKPGRVLRLWSSCGITALTFFALYYLYLTISP